MGVIRNGVNTYSIMFAISAALSSELLIRDINRDRNVNEAPAFMQEYLCVITIILLAFLIS